MIDDFKDDNGLNLKFHSIQLQFEPTLAASVAVFGIGSE